MEDKQYILQQALEKAIDNGYELNESSFNDYNIRDNWLRAITRSKAYYYIIFSHDFAKAFWKYDCNCGSSKHIYEWKTRLQQMVISEDPIKYLEQFLEVTQAGARQT